MNTFPIASLAVESVRFDMQAMENPEISGTGYQQGTLAGYEAREYLLEKFARTCAYCKKKDIPLQIEHIVPKALGGSNRISNLTLACEKCNQKKGAQTAEEFGHPQVQAQAKRPLKDAAAVNTTRKEIVRRLEQTGLAIEQGTGGMTKFNRTQRGMAKTHWADAACVGMSTPAQIIVAPTLSVLEIKAMGHGNRQMCRTNKYGFPKTHKTRNKTFLGFRTGDYVRANVPTGKAAGVHVGRVTIRQRPGFILGGKDMHAKYITRIQRADGYEYKIGIVTGADAR